MYVWFHIFQNFSEIIKVEATLRSFRDRCVICAFSSSLFLSERVSTIIKPNRAFLISRQLTQRRFFFSDFNLLNVFNGTRRVKATRHAHACAGSVRCEHLNGGSSAFKSRHGSTRVFIRRGFNAKALMAILLSPRVSRCPITLWNTPYNLNTGAHRRTRAPRRVAPRRGGKCSQPSCRRTRRH